MNRREVAILSSRTQGLQAEGARERYPDCTVQYGTECSASYSRSYPRNSSLLKIAAIHHRSYNDADAIKSRGKVRDSESLEEISTTSNETGVTKNDIMSIRSKIIWYRSFRSPENEV